LPSRPFLIVILGSLVAIGPLSIDMYLPGLPEITRSLDATAAAVQLSLTACVAGLAVGQLVAGPMSDRLGRRRPLVIGLVTYSGVSLLCALAPTVLALTGLRFLQGLAGGAGIVIGRAVVRDLYAGAQAAKLFSSLMLVTGLAPILAPVVGAQILKVTTWHGIFVVLAALSAAIVTLAAIALPETLPKERRDPGGHTLATMRHLLTQRSFLGYALTAGLAFGALFAYISGSPFVLQEIYGLSPQAFSFAFGANGLGLVIGSQINARLVSQYGPAYLLRRALVVIVVAAAALVVVTSIDLGVWPVIACTFVVMSTLSFVMPNSTALALAEHGAVAGTASALLGVTQFLIGGLAAPLVGIGGTGSALPMAVVMLSLASGAVLVNRWLS
jgi:MFS transporter, DHA1 family, multidrug resistance protein